MIESAINCYHQATDVIFASGEKEKYVEALKNINELIHEALQ